MKRNGFTLLELLVVIAIIGVLTAIALPNFGAVKHEDEAAKCKANLQAIEMALESYYAENGTYPTSSPGSLDTLVSQGYLKVKPECVTADGVSHVYEWKTDFAGTTFTFQAVGANPPVETTHTYKAGRVFCPYHGTLDSVDWHPDGPPTGMIADPGEGGGEPL
ncbi:MAG: type II secretion system protein [Chitinophagales bacterium]